MRETVINRVTRTQKNWTFSAFLIVFYVCYFISRGDCMENKSLWEIYKERYLNRKTLITDIEKFLIVEYGIELLAKQDLNGFMSFANAILVKEQKRMQAFQNMDQEKIKYD